MDGPHRRESLDYVHRCGFCGWSRDAASAAMVDPLCEECGCGLTSLRRSEIPARERSDLEELQRVIPRLPADVLHALRIAFVVLVTVAAARWGLHAGGTAIAVVAFGAAGLCAVPMVVPGRYGAAPCGSSETSGSPPAPAASTSSPATSSTPSPS